MPTALKKSAASAKESDPAKKTEKPAKTAKKAAIVTPKKKATPLVSGREGRRPKAEGRPATVMEEAKSVAPKDLSSDLSPKALATGEALAKEEAAKPTSPLSLSPPPVSHPLDEGESPAPTETPVLSPVPAEEGTAPNAASAPPKEKPAAKETATAAPAKPGEDHVIHLKPPIIVKDLATKMGVKPFQLISDLMAMKILVSINQAVEPDIARKLCGKHGFKLELERRGEHPVKVPEAPKPEELRPKPSAKIANLVPRPPVVTIMGHVDHGKTSLLDSIRKANVAAGEAGGITQHIGAYTVSLPASGKDNTGGRLITFLDTPGHEAFTAMRARGANVTDIVILVVAGDDGLMPQTLEAINHAKAAGVPMIVAINKMDLEAAQKMKDRVKKQLQEQGLAPEEWGGKTITVEVSATKKTGIDQLLEMILLQAEMMEIKAERDVPAEGNVLEAQMESGRGPTATLLVRKGVLKVGSPLIVGPYWGKIKALVDDHGKMLKEATPSMAVKVIGLSGVPDAGASFRVAASENECREHGLREQEKMRMQKLEAPKRLTLEDLLTPATDQRKTLKIILKTDVQGSCEAIREALSKLPQDKVELSIIHATVGPITESDVLLAAASKALVVGFQIKVDPAAAELAKKELVEIQLFRIIYELTDKITEFMSGLLDPESKAVNLGQAEVKQIFQMSKGGNVAGCVVRQGHVNRKARVRVVRRKNTLFEGAIATLRRFQDDVSEVRLGLECGLRVDGFNDFEVGDTLEFYQIEKVAAKL